MGRVLVTGGAGFIGSHLAEALISAGEEVCIMDDLSTGDRDNLPSKVEFHHLDIRAPAVEAIFRKRPFDMVFHEAAQIDVRKSVQDPVGDIGRNIGGSVALLELARKYGVGKFIFASSGGAVYGEQDAFPASEDHPLRPVSPYGITKLAVEKFMFYYNVEYGLHCTALRYGNVYGPRQNPFGEAGVVAIFCHKLLAGEQPMINGDGLQTRDYVFVSDVVAANMAARGLEGFNAINIGTGIETDVVGIFDALNIISGKDMPRVHKDAAPGEQRRSCISPALAEKLLAWQPIIRLEAGLKDTFEYFQSL